MLAWGWVVVSLVVIFPLELLRQAPMHWRLYPWVIGFMAFGNTMAAAWITGGRGQAKVFFVPALFALTGIPWPTFLENAVSFPLMGVVTSWSAGILQVFGYPATVSGNVITLPNCSVGVEEACSGLRSMQTALMLGIAAGELKLFGWRGRLALLFLASALALFGNQVRVLILALAGIRGGSQAVDNVHDLAGYAVLAILLGGVAVGAWIISKFAGQVGSDATADALISRASGGKGVHFAGGIALVVALFAMVAAHAWYWFARGEVSRPTGALLEPRRDAGFIVDAEVPPAVLAQLRPDEWSYIRATKDDGPGEVVGYHFYWYPDRGNARQMYHRPDSCMPGAGWWMDGEVTRETLRVGDRKVIFNVFPFRNRGARSRIYWAAYLNGQPLDLDLNSDLKPATAKLLHFVRNGVRTHSYEVSAFLLTQKDGGPPFPDAQMHVNRVFRPVESKKALHE